MQTLRAQRLYPGAAHSREEGRLPSPPALRLTHLLMTSPASQTSHLRAISLKALGAVEGDCDLATGGHRDIRDPLIEGALLLAAVHPDVAVRRGGW